MLWIVAIIHVNLIPDKNAPQAPVQQNAVPVQPASTKSVADELKKYKELLDQGVITEDEFQQQKAKILII